MRVTVAAVLLLAAGASAAARQAIPAGDAGISGRVIDRVTERPVAGAVIRLDTADLRRTLVTDSDASGLYAFEGIPAGDYRLTAEHPDYVVHVFGHDVERNVLLTTGTPQGLVTVSARQTRPNVDFALVRGASIRGRVTTHDHRPLADASVTLISTAATSGNRTRESGGSARTNANGEYLIANVPEGLYLVMAQWLPRERPAAGGGTAFRPTYYPGTERSSEATTLRVYAGDIHREIDMSLAAREWFKIAGQVLRGSQQGRVSAYLISAARSQRTVMVQDDGAFSVPQLEAGRYTLVARAGEGDRTEAAATTIDLTSDVTELLLGLAATGTLAGRVVTADGTPLPDGLQVAAILAENGQEIDPLPRDRVDVRSDGAFELHGVFGNRVIRITGLDARWQVARILAGKTEETDVTVQPGERLGVTILLSRR